MKQFLQRYRLYIVVCLGYAVFCLATSALTGLNIYAFMIWNLFLAILPFIISYTLTHKKRPLPITILLLVFWLLFIPNSFYVITDLIHLSQFTYYYHVGADFTNPVYIYDIRIWLGLINIVAGVVLASIAGLQSLRQVHKFLVRNLCKFALPIMLAVFTLIGFAIYIGRFLRFNSWDVLNPVTLFSGIAGDFNLFTLEFTILFASAIAIIYSLYYKFQIRYERLHK